MFPSNDKPGVIPWPPLTRSSVGKSRFYFLSSSGQFTTRVRLNEFSRGACIIRKRLASGETSN